MAVLKRLFFLINLKHKKWNWFYKKSIHPGNLLTIMPPEINIHTGTLYKTTTLLKMLKEYIIKDILKKNIGLLFLSYLKR